MTEQQDHLKNLIQQYQTLTTEVKNLQDQIASKKETLLKIQGAVEYLSQIGVQLEEEPVEDPVEESAEE